MAETGATVAATKRSIFKRGQKAELFEDGQEVDEREELQGKLGDLHAVWALERTGRDLAAAIWRQDLGMAEVVLQKGKLLAHMGVMQGAKLYLFIEEAVYLLDRANLLLFLDRPAPGDSRQRRQLQRRQRLLSLAEAHDLMLAAGVAMEHYLVFCKLLRAGYIVQRHPARWLVRPAEDLGQVWAGWSRAPAALAAGQQTLGGAAASQQSVQQPRQEQAAPLAGPPSKRRKLQGEQLQLRNGLWWVATASGVQQPQVGSGDEANHEGDSASRCSSSSANPWLRFLPTDFLDSLPRCQVLPMAAAHVRDQFPHMAPLQSIPLAELQPLGGAASGQHLLHFDVFTSNSRFSRKAPGKPACVISVSPSCRLPTPYDMAAADAAANGIPVRFSSVEQGDIGSYGLAHVELRSILAS